MYDVIIIGSGPAGMSAALYLLRDGKKVLIIEKETIGGTIASTPIIENYPGVKSMSGADLTEIMYDQIDALGVDLEIEEVKKIEIENDLKKVITENNSYYSKAVIIASGSTYRLLNLENEKNLIGHGIHFCVACDGAFYKNKDVVIVGGGNSAVTNAISLSKIASHVYLIQNLDNLTCENDLKEKITNIKNIDILYNSTVKKYLGKDELEGLIINSDNQEKELKVDGVFLNIGLIPQNNFVKDLVNLDKYGYIVSSDTKTNIPGIFVAGDSRTKKYAQVTIATADGTIAALDTIAYLNNL